MMNFMERTLDMSIARVYAQGYASYGDLGIGQEDFSARLMSLVEKHLGAKPSNSSAVSFIENLYTNDLYLTAACARRTENAWEIFTKRYGRYIKDLTAFATRTSCASDLADDILIDLFLPDHSGQSRIGSYEGRSSLATWLRVVVSHRAVNEHERTRHTFGGAECLCQMADELALNRVGAELRACRYERIIEDSLRHACQSLTARERLILVLRFEEELHLGQIARLLNVHQSTVTRQLEKAYNKLQDEMITTLSSKYHLNQCAIDECKEDILENPSYSILALIKSA
ncbi:MAG TPA: sigma-70 family RNA polymerase sigma factor [Pyrinomonadaceae bacterium]|jgi:RNA polymerase sigma-70 factor